MRPAFGEWRSLVAHFVRDEGVGGSNPLSPTKFKEDNTRLSSSRNPLTTAGFFVFISSDHRFFLSHFGVPVHFSAIPPQTQGGNRQPQRFLPRCWPLSLIEYVPLFMSQIKDALENRQTGIYFLTMVAAAVMAVCWPTVSGVVVVLNPALAFMLFVTFLSLPLGEMLNAFRHARFLLALFIANFVAIPALVALLLTLFPLPSVVAYGVAMVLLCPCIDYVVTFCQQGQADSRLLLAATPLLLLSQMLLLPLYLSLLFDTAQSINIELFLHAFITMIAIPLLLALIFQRWSKTTSAGQVMTNWLGCLPVPATALVLAVITAFVVPQLAQSRSTALTVLPVYLLFSALAPLAGWGVARLFELNAAAGRGVMFSAGTRNSLVILPLALAVPGALPLMPVVVVTQTLVELIAELIYVRCAPRLRFHAGK